MVNEETEMTSAKAKTTTQVAKEIFKDKVETQLQQSVVVLDDFTEFPSIRVINEVVYLECGKFQSLAEVN